MFRWGVPCFTPTSVSESCNVARIWKNNTIPRIRGCLLVRDLHELREGLSVHPSIRLSVYVTPYATTINLLSIHATTLFTQYPLSIYSASIHLLSLQNVSECLDAGGGACSCAIFMSCEKVLPFTCTPASTYPTNSRVYYYEQAFIIRTSIIHTNKNKKMHYEGLGQSPTTVKWQNSFFFILEHAR
jgi:hypothetical protein